MATHAQRKLVHSASRAVRLHRFQQWLLGFPLIALPFFLGGARPWLWSTVAGVFFLGVLVLLAMDRLETNVPLDRPWTWVLGGVLGLVFLQAAPLPSLVLEGLNPERLRWIQRAREATGLDAHWMSLSHQPLDTFFYACWGGFLVLFALLFRNILQHEKGLQWLFVVLYAMAGFQAFYGLLQVLIPSMGVLWEASGSPGAAQGTFVNRNHYAAFLGMVWPLLLANLMALRPPAEKNAKKRSFLEMEKDRKLRQKQIFLTVLVGLVLLSLVFSRSRGGIMGALVAFTVFVLLGGRQRRGVLLFVLSCWLVMIGYGSVIGFDQIIARFDLIQDAAPSRFLIWESTWQMILDHPWVGTGLGTFSMVIQLYQTHLPDHLNIGHAHNDYLELMAELGIPAALLLIGLAWGYWWKTAWGVRSAGAVENGGSGERERHLLRLGALAGSAAFLFHGWVEFNWAIPANQVYFVMLLVLMGSRRGAEFAEKSRDDAHARE